MPRQAQQSSSSFRRQYHHSYSYGLESSSSKYSMKSNTVTISTTANTSLSSLISVESTTEETTTTLAPLSPLATPHHKAATAAAAALPPPPPENILWSDVKVGAKIGEGNFSTVHKVQLIETTKKNQEDEIETTPHSPQDKLHQKNNTSTPEEPSLPPRLVLKRAKQSSFDQDITAEAEIFQRLPEHEHIVRLVGVGRSSSVVANEEGASDSSASNAKESETTSAPPPAESDATTPPVPSDSSQENPNFLILEHLEGGTLHDRLQRLRRQDTRERIREAIASSPSSSSSSRRRPGPRGSLVSGAKKKIQQLLLSRRKQPQKQSKEEDQQRQVQHQRVHICGLLGLAKALWHVHHHKIAYMDLKPHNVGYSKYGVNHKNKDDSCVKSSDVGGHDIADHDDSLVHNETHGGGRGDTVKLFDFGLSQVIAENSTGDNGDCNHKDMTPSSNDAICAGTPRYMAPEILALLGKQQPQSQQQQQNQRESSSRHTATAADVYSFGVLLWEVATLERPYQRVESLDQLQRALCVRQQRPEIQRVACPELRALLKACWDKDPAARPSMRTVAEQLDQILFRFMGSAPS